MAGQEEGPTAEKEEKHDDRQKGGQNIDRVFKHIGRDIADHQVAEHTAAHRGDDTQDNDAEKIQPFTHSNHCTGRCEGNGADDLHRKYDVGMYLHGCLHLRSRAYTVKTG